MTVFTKAGRSDAVSEREEKNRGIAYRAACESMVLLKNDGALPFASKKIALYGAGAAHTVKGGTGSGEVNERYSVSILEGLENRGFVLGTRQWLEDYEALYARELAAFEKERRQFYKRIGQKSLIDIMMGSFQLPAGRAVTEEDVRASETDSCVYVLSRQAGEGGDRRAEPGDYFLTETELESIRLCAARYSRFVLAINCGSSMDMAFAEQIPDIDAIVYLCQLGTEGGNAFADLLSGAVTPSGKLADSWARTYSDIPFAMDYSYLNGNVEDEYYNEGIYVGYRYFDSFKKEPLYPFGFGLSYTDFSIEAGAVRVEGGCVSVEAVVKNTGDCWSGMETAQLYVSAPNGKLDKEYQSLAAFAKSSLLPPGAQEKLTLRFDLRSLASFDEERASHILEAGDYILRLGSSSRDTKAVAVLTLDGEAVVSVHEHVCPRRCPLRELKAEPYAFEDTSALPRCSVAAAQIAAVRHSYAAPAPCADARVRAFVDALSPEEMTEIVVGAGMFAGGRFNLPGAVGNTTPKFWDRGLANVALCDGPAGLRIQSRSTMDKKGKIKPLEMPLTVMEMLPGFVKKAMKGDPEREMPLYQYATAFPVAAALAQTWNEALLYELGKAVYEEMRQFGCCFWLAPAMNIHRNPLCGRNFEYFSEDPLLSGRMAAAISRGVQQEDGYYVTIKHFACNNQEESRNTVSSDVSERALREIYLKGFSIAVREGKAKSVMTSYNRLNGVYTPNSYDLCTKVLRNEWGFEGVVMTDWFSTMKGRGDSALAMRAGNDLIMPGGASYKRAILRGLREGKLELEDLRRCCSNVVRAILASQTQKEYIG